MVGTQRSRVWQVHRGAGYCGYTEEQGMVGTQRSRVWWVHRGAGYGGYTKEQGMVGKQRSRVWWVHMQPWTSSSDIHVLAITLVSFPDQYDAMFIA